MPKKWFGLRLDPDELAWWRRAARLDRRTIAGFVRVAVEDRIIRIAPNLPKPEVKEEELP